MTRLKQKKLKSSVKRDDGLDLSQQQIAEKLLAWYGYQGRANLPWRLEVSPYRVWLSEIMLQQTQVTTVIPYFERFLKRFPTIAELACADLDEVLHLWAGLGYYARARNLHKTAVIVHQQHSGNFPNDLDGLIKLPGIGRSTAGAILAIAYNKPYPILDGNVRRILTRLFEVPGWPGSAKVQSQLWQFSSDILPKKRNDDFTQAIMDLAEFK